MASRRDAILHGAKEASRLHRDLGIRARMEGHGGRIDVFRTIVDLDLPLLFRPLKGLLGAFLPGPYPGIMVTDQRPLAIQRFTGAHELGHAAMKHQGSLDDDSILHRSPFGTTDYDFNELAADAFATAFLTPEWLLETHAALQGWGRESMVDPRLVYQLSLRVGTSFEATCRALSRYGIINRTTMARHSGLQPRKIKESLLDGYRPANWWPDIWVLTERDEGTEVEGGPNDIFVVKLRENSAAGYVWNFDELKAAGFAIVRDDRTLPNADLDVGGAVERRVMASADQEVHGKVKFVHIRPWQPEPPAGRLSFSYELFGELFGRETGMSRVERRQIEAA